MSDPEIVPLDPQRRSEAAAVLGAAFRDNPIFVAALRGVEPDARVVQLTRLFRGFVRCNLRRGTASCVLIDGRIAAVSLAHAPGTFPLGAIGWLDNGLNALGLGIGSIIRLARLSGVIEREHFRDRHWYLYMLGVDPAHQGRGLGGKLVARHVEGATRDGVPAYLETDRPENVGFYERFGYRVTRELRVRPLGDMPMWLMLRSLSG
jgi:ribosomal protein S18 acetylase RimI-like enzyme